MSEGLLYGTIGWAFCILWGRAVYGSWPWEFRKTWYWCRRDYETWRRAQ